MFITVSIRFRNVGTLVRLSAVVQLVACLLMMQAATCPVPTEVTMTTHKRGGPADWQFK
jgi:hypothetical protein